MNSKIDGFEMKHAALISEQNELYKKRGELRKALESMEIELEKHQEKIENNCLSFFGKHDFETFREEGPYGERYYVCKHCGCQN